MTPPDPTPPDPRGRSGLAALATASGGGRSQLFDSVGGGDLLLDSGLPSLLFVVVFLVSGSRLTPALVAALASAVVLAAVRVARRRPLQNVAAGLVGLAISAAVVVRTGRPEDIFLPGLLINVGYLVAYLVSILVKWPLLGIIVALARGADMSWRRDPAELRAFSLASWVWVGLFAARLLVKVPLYLAGADALVALGVVNLLMGWPLFFCCVWLSYVIIARALRRHAAAERAAEEEPQPGRP